LRRLVYVLPVLILAALAFHALVIRAPGPSPALSRTVPATAAEAALSYAAVVRQTAPAVVNIYATRMVADRRGGFADDPFFRDLFRDFAQGQPRLENSLGSGVIVSGDGLVVSNFHVVGGATDIRVVLNDRREYAADLILADEDSDLAVLRLRDAPDLPSLALADSDRAEVGDLVLAIGNPFGVGQTVSQGIISGLGRSTMSLGAGRGYFLQTDAAINPGNSGGALVDMQGRLLGINTAILTRGGGSNGVGFAIPANLVARVIAQAAEGHDRFIRPWAGLGGQAVDMGVAQALGLDAPRGVVVTELHPVSPFAASGIAPGDVIVTLDGQPVNSPQEVMFRLAVAGPGATVRLGYLHGGEMAEAEATLSPPPRGDRQEVTLTDNLPLRGLSVATLDPALVADLDLPLSAAGVIVTEARDRAARTGLQAGDLILAINGMPVATTEDVARAASERVRRWAIDVLRGGRPLRLMFRL
jgi:Do/DeqQ family serine protease